MCNKLVSKLLGLDHKEAQIAQIKADTQNSIDKVTAVLKRQGKLQEIVIQKTTTFYLAQAIGIIK